MFPRVADTLISQAMLANSLVQAFDLERVALLGAGVPSPLMPPPEQVAYYTDIDATAVDEGREAGYHSLIVDVRDSAQVNQLQGVRDAVGTGLMHFLPDEELTPALQNLADAGIQRLAFNHVDHTEIGKDQPIAQNFVAQMYQRTPEELRALIPSAWEVRTVQSMKDFYQSADPTIYQHIHDLPNIYNIYLLEQV